MRTVPFEFEGETYHLLLNGAALFDIYDRYGSEGSVTDPIKGNSRAALEAVCWYLEELAGQGELWRRYEGRDPQKIPAAADFLVRMSPLDVLRAQSAIRQAVHSGFLREEEEKREIDKGLLELEKKNGRRLTRAQYLNAAAQFLRLNVREALLLPVGLVLDMEELEIQRRGLREKDGRQ